MDGADARRSTRRSRAAVGAAAWALLSSAVLTAHGTALADEDSVRRGRSLFEIHCSSCHGEDGLGAGPAASELESDPGDLTRIRADNDGVWPHDRLVQVVDGRQVVPGHGRREMPVWGLSFQNLDRPEGQEAEVEARIEALLTYIESLQRGSD